MLPRLLLVTMAFLAGLGPAMASVSVRYHGVADLDFQTSNSQPHPGAMNGRFGYTAIFFYDDLGAQTAASLIVADVLRAHYTYCPPRLDPDWQGPTCEPLNVTPNSIASITGTTPEDYIGVGVFSPTQFGGIPLFGPGTRTYDLVPGDTSMGYLSWALFDNKTGYAWNSGYATVTRFVIGIPEPATWLMLVIGFGMTGMMVRRAAGLPQPAASAAAPRR